MAAVDWPFISIVLDYCLAGHNCHANWSHEVSFAIDEDPLSNRRTDLRYCGLHEWTTSGCSTSIANPNPIAYIHPNPHT
jgi:hypothetical protein